MKNLRLKEVLKEDFWIMPATPKFIDNGIPYITSKNIKNGRINFDNIKFISDNDYEKISKNRPILENDILISMIGTLGETAVVHKDDGSFYGQNMLLVRLDTNLITQRFFINFFKSNSIKNQLLSKQNKSTQSYLKLTHIEDLILPAYSIVEQTKISKRLDLIQEIISKKQKQLNSLDNLIKSLFVEIFENKDYEKKSLNSISLGKGEYGSGAKAGDYKENLPRYVRITDINENGTLDDNFSSPLNEKKIEKYSLNYGDIIFARTGATVGKTYMYSEKDGWCIFAGFCIRFKLNTKLVNPKYIFKFTQTEKYKAWIKNKQRIVAQPNINAKEYGEELLIPIPPIELQNKFAEFVNQIDKQKFEIQNGLNKMKELYETLINKYFG